MYTYRVYLQSLTGNQWLSVENHASLQVVAEWIRIARLHDRLVQVYNPITGVSYFMPR